MPPTGDDALVAQARARLLRPGRVWADLDGPADYERAAWEALAVLVNAAREPNPAPAWPGDRVTYSSAALYLRELTRRPLRLAGDGTLLGLLEGALPCT